MIHCIAAASLLLVGIFLLFVSSSQSYATAIDIDTDDDYMTDEEIESQIDKLLTLWGNDTETAGIDMDEVRKMLIDAASGKNNMIEEFLHDIENIDDDIENDPPSKLSNEEKRELIFKHQDDPFNVYERWKWDPQFCSAGVWGVGLTTKTAYNPNMVEILNGVCEMVVKIGLRILSILKREASLVFPWNPDLFISHLDLDSVSEGVIQDSKEAMGDSHPIGAIIARLDPATYKVLSIGYTKDYESLWNKRKEDKSNPLLMISDSYLFEVLDPKKTNPYIPYQPELKFLTDYLILLFGHSFDKAKRWVGETAEGNTTIDSIAMEIILTTLYTTLTALGGDTQQVDIPEYDKEPPFKEFISQLGIKKFIVDMEYNHDTGITIDDLIAERQQDWDEL